MSALFLSDDWNGPWVQVDGDAEVLHMPDAEQGLVDYYRCVSGEHPDWAVYREPMRLQGTSLTRITRRVGPGRPAVPRVSGGTTRRLSVFGRPADQRRLSMSITKR